MKILVHTIFYRPELTGVAKYTAEMCEWLAVRGHQVEVVCPPPYYPHWKVESPFRQWRYVRESMDGVRVTRCPIRLPRKPGGLQRILYSLSFLLSSLPVMLARTVTRPDVVFVLEPSLLNAIKSLLVARLTGALAWLQIKDFEIDLAFDLGQLRQPWLRLALAWFETWLMRRFDVVSTISRSMEAKTLAKGVRTKHLVFFPDWVDTEVIFPLPEASPMRQQLDISAETTVALFAGTLGAKQGIETLLEAATELATSPDSAARGLLVVICGDGPSAKRLRAVAAGLVNVRFLPLQPAERLNELLNMADIHVLPQVPEAADSVLPSKLLGMLASGRPIVATVGPHSEIAALMGSGGEVVPPGEPRALAAALRSLAADSKARTTMGAAARARAMESLQLNAVLKSFEGELSRRVPRSAQLALGNQSHV
jgi:colanic acid biosynthesis glycosyl transferase WcaI